MQPKDAIQIAKRARKLLRAGKITHRQLAIVDALLWCCRSPSSGGISNITGMSAGGSRLRFGRGRFRDFSDGMAMLPRIIASGNLQAVDAADKRLLTRADLAEIGSLLLQIRNQGESLANLWG